jgi:peptidoglycan hydrolase CwlO-like protein
VNVEWLIGSGVLIVLAFARNESRTNQNTKDIEEFKANGTAFNQSLLNEIKELRKDFHEQDKNITKLIERIDHLNKKVTNLEKEKLEPILEEYYKRK